MLLLSVNKKIKILNPINKIADFFAVRFHTELAWLKKTGIVIIKNHVVRFHSPTTETTVVKTNSQKFIVRENPNAR